jgi:uncharacterized protein
MAPSLPGRYTGDVESGKEGKFLLSRSEVEAAASRRMSVADPIHGLLQFDRTHPSDRLLLEVMNCQAFQRLRRIKQMGLAEFVFPGATHSRFIHSLGCVHLMSSAIRHFNTFDSTRRILQAPYKHYGIPLERLMLLAILIHDIGHTPLSHTLEDLLGLKEQGLHHDYYWNRRILREDPELVSVWEKHGPFIPEAIADFMGEGGEKHYMAAMVSSQLDMDRLDYLQRDSHFLGVQYGRIEANRIISSLVVGKGPYGAPVVAVREEAVPAIEHYLFGRHQAYKMALHSLDKASETVLKATLRRFKWSIEQGIETGSDTDALYRLMTDAASLSVDEFLSMDDCYLWHAVSQWSRKAEDEILRVLACRMLKHELFKFVDLKKYGYDQPLSTLPDVLEALQKHYLQRGLSFEFGFDELVVMPKPLYTTSDREPIWVRTYRGELRDLSDISSMSLTAEPARGQKHLVFLWDKKAKHYLMNLLESRFPRVRTEDMEDEEEGFI